MPAAARVGDQGSYVGMHAGRALLQIASTYPTVLEIVMEQVQNALDANATRIGIILNQRTRRIVITDNGDGVKKEDFELALGQVCSSVKQAGKLGRFGIGLISPLGKCESFSFTSCPKGVQQGYIEWTFDTEDIRKQGDSVIVPHRHVTDHVFRANAPGTGGQRNGTMLAVPYRTRVAIQKYSTDKIINRIGNLDSLVESILERFGATMRKNKVLLSVKFTTESGVEEVRENIKPVAYTGRPLDEIRIVDTESGLTIFRLFLARKTTQGYRGKVTLGEADNDYRFPFSSFVQVGRQHLPQEVIEALSSGIFEGEILSSRATLHANRKNFERNEAFVDFCLTIEQWYNEHGKQHLAKIKEASEEERYQDLGLRSLKTFEEMLKQPRFKELNDIILGFRRGTIGSGHTEPDEAGVLGSQKEPSLSTQSVKDPEETTGGSGGGSPKTENPDHQPYTVTGPHGQRRTVVSKGSLGLQFSHVAMEGSDRLYELDARHGVLHFNIRHPLWVSCEDNDRQVMQLQEFIALTALTALTMPADWKDVIQEAFSDLNQPFVYLIQNSSAFRHSIRPKTPETPAS